MKELFMQGILSNQEGQDTLEWTAIAALIVLVQKGSDAPAAMQVGRPRARAAASLACALDSDSI